MRKSTHKKPALNAIGGDISNGAADDIEFSAPYGATVTIQGVSAILFHAWNIESIEEKARAAKGSKIKKTDNLEASVYRMSETDKRLGMPGPNFGASLVEAARYLQDPRSPRKSARDLVRAGVIIVTPVAPFEPATKEWHFVDQRRVTVQRAGVTRRRPALREGWRLTFEVLVTLPEYVTPDFLRALVYQAGKLVGLGDFRPTYGRFDLIHFENGKAS
jgi:hypothetical protein